MITILFLPEEVVRALSLLNELTDGLVMAV